LSKEEIEIRAEERRALVLLGLLAFLVGLWDKLPSNATFNFPTNSTLVPTVGVNANPLLELLIGLWIGYGICMFFYFSDDWLQGKTWWTEFRKFWHGLGRFLLGMLLVIFSALVIAEISLFLPDYAQGGYWFASVLMLFLLAWIIWEHAFRGNGPKAIKEWLRTIAELSREVKSALLERFSKGKANVKK